MAIAAAAALVVGGCGDDGDGERSQPSITAPSTTSTTTATTAVPEPERIEVEAPPGEPRPDIDVNVTYPSDFTDDQVAVVEAYRGFWHAVYVASDPPDPYHPLLSQYATLERLQGVQAGLVEYQAKGWVSRIPTNGVYAHSVLYVEVQGDEAIVRDCSVDDGHVIDSVTGAVLDDDVVTREVEYSAFRVGGEWRVGGSEPRVLNEWNGVGGCADSLS